MENFKGIKGDWVIENISAPQRICISSENSSRFIDCWGGGITETTKEEMRAKALLIEMLELLIHFTNATPNDGTWNYQACMDKAHQHIKSATELNE